MALVTRVQLVDDLDGGEATESVNFALDGSAYAIDLSSKHAASFREAFAKYLAAGRKVDGRSRTASSVPADGPGRGVRARAGRALAGRPDTKAVRAWASEQGIKVSQRGRVSANLVAQFSAAQR